ncbi:MAG: oxygen-independent coproporphyrinogen oxidase [Verrucomicrobiales bacterium]|nr:oxygen-independent coproporphyrinogen oxidase [Verrucomicrobiales bacterium]
MSTLQVDLELVKKYSVPGPRYTSYPPATQFTETIGVAALQEKVRAANAGGRDLSLYFHLPFCESLCWFCGCTTVITTDHKVSGKYLDYLGKEMALVRPLIDAKRKVTQLHFGGGTPTFLSPDELRRLGKMIHAQFEFADDFEAGVEIDPRHVTKDHVLALREIGFNRASMGVQDNNPEVQKAVHRIQPLAQTKQAVDWLREAGFKSINIDLIYGLPYQTPESFEKTLGEILALQPDRFAVFNYAHVPWMKPAQKILEAKILPTPETKMQVLKMTIEKLTSNGYAYIGMDHFARETDELTISQREKTLQRNFQGYSTRGGADIYAFGMSAISQAGDTYWQNIKELPEYYAAVEAGTLPWTRGYVLTKEDEIRRTTIMRLMCDLGLDYSVMSGLLGIDFKEHFATEIASLDDMEADGLLVKTPQGITVTDLGRLLIRNIAMRFDEYLPKQTERRFSKTI